MRNRNNPVRVTEEEAVRQRFAQWRQEYPERPALPAALWSAATELARRQGVSRTRGAWSGLLLPAATGGGGWKKGQERVAAPAIVYGTHVQRLAEHLGMQPGKAH